MTPHLRQIREVELEEAVRLMPAGADVLEIGAGSGWQARRLADRGYRVSAVEIAGSYYLEQAVFDIRIYDGRKLPFADSSFDVVFSSNVLEHVPHLPDLDAEIHRVLRPAGIAVHVVPTGSWRLWTSFGHYLHALKQHDLWGWRRILRRPLAALRAIATAGSPVRHGERGNVWTEIWYFSRWYWTGLFRALGWRVVSRGSTRLLYTGYSVFDADWSLASRRFWSRFAGSSCHVFELRPRAAA